MADQPVDLPPGLVILDLGPDWVHPINHALVSRDLIDALDAHGEAIPFLDYGGDVEGPAVDLVCINGWILAMVESPNAHPGDQRRAKTSIKKSRSKWKNFARVGGNHPTPADMAIRNWADGIGLIKFKVVHFLDQDGNRICTRAEVVHGDGRTFVFFVPLLPGAGNRNRKRKRDADDEDDDDSRYNDDDDGVGSATSASTAALSPISMAPGSDSGEEMPERHAEPVGPPPSKRQKVANTPSFDQGMPDVTSTAAAPGGVALVVDLGLLLADIPTVAMEPVAANDRLLPFADQGVTSTAVPGGVAPVPTGLFDLPAEFAGFGPTVPVATAAVAAAADEEMVYTIDNLLNGFQDDTHTEEMATGCVNNYAVSWSDFPELAFEDDFDIGSSEPWLPIDFSTDDSFTLTTRNTGQENAIDFNGLSSVAW